MNDAKGAAAAGATAVAEKLCPKCESPMVERKSKYGPFFGCSSYPKCTHVDRTR